MLVFYLLLLGTFSENQDWMQFLVEYMLGVHSGFLLCNEWDGPRCLTHFPLSQNGKKKLVLISEVKAGINNPGLLTFQQHIFREWLISDSSTVTSFLYFHFMVAVPLVFICLLPCLASLHHPKGFLITLDRCRVPSIFWWQLVLLHVCLLMAECSSCTVCQDHRESSSS